MLRPAKPFRPETLLSLERPGLPPWDGEWLARGHSAASDPQDECVTALLPSPTCSLEHSPFSVLRPKGPGSPPLPRCATPLPIPWSTSESAGGAGPCPPPNLSALPGCPGAPPGCWACSVLCSVQLADGTLPTWPHPAQAGPGQGAGMGLMAGVLHHPTCSSRFAEHHRGPGFGPRGAG